MASLSAPVAVQADNGYGGSSFFFTTRVTVQSGVTGFVRFAGLAVPQGATINTATMTASWDIDSASAMVTVQAVAADNAAAPTTGPQLLALPLTSASASWSTPSRNAGQTATTPSLASVIQEVVNRPGWASGNALTLVITGSTGTIYLASQSETLTLDYTGGGPSTFLASAIQALPSVTQAASVTVTVPAFTGTASQALPAVTQAFDGLAVAPFTVTATVTGPTVDLSWPARTGSGYAVERDGAVVAFGLTGTTYTDSPGEGEHTYRIGVLA